MAVVVNEFEVVPAPQPAPPAAANPAPDPKPPASVRDEIERTLRIRASRAARLEAC